MRTTVGAAIKFRSQPSMMPSKGPNGQWISSSATPKAERWPFCGAQWVSFARTGRCSYWKGRCLQAVRVQGFASLSISLRHLDIRPSLLNLMALSESGELKNCGSGTPMWRSFTRHVGNSHFYCNDDSDTLGATPRHAQPCAETAVRWS